MAASCAQELIDSIWRTPFNGGFPNPRPITERQYNFLRELLEREDPVTVHWQAAGVVHWLPQGREKWAITPDRARSRFYLTKLANIVSSGSGELFPKSERKEEAQSMRP